MVARRPAGLRRVSQQRGDSEDRFDLFGDHNLFRFLFVGETPSSETLSSMQVATNWFLISW